jgi:hypothetical protein
MQREPRRKRKSRVMGSANPGSAPWIVSAKVGGSVAPLGSQLFAPEALLAPAPETILPLPPGSAALHPGATAHGLT